MKKETWRQKRDREKVERIKKQELQDIADRRSQKVREIMVREESLKAKRGMVQRNKSDTAAYKSIEIRNFNCKSELNPEFICPSCQSENIDQVTPSQLYCINCKHRSKV